LVPVVLVAAYASAFVTSETPSEHLVNVLRGERFTTGRLAAQTKWRPCVAVEAIALIPRMRCGPPIQPHTRRFRRIANAHREVLRARPPDSSIAVLRGTALVELQFADTKFPALNRAAASLQQAHQLAPGDAGVLNDLAVAYLAMGERTQQLTPMLRALDAVERAAAADSLDLSILFNRALILQRLYLIGSAERAWARYLAIERDRRWRSEAERYAQWVSRVPMKATWGSVLAAPPEPLNAATRSRIAALVRHAPHAARDSAFMILGNWGTALSGADTLRATRMLALARGIGEAADSIGADHGVALAVAAIDRASNAPARLATLAEGHIRLASGYRLYYEAQYEKAAASLQSAEKALRSEGSPAARWAAFYHAAADINLARFDDADRRLAFVLNEATVQEPGLMGKAIWARGVNQLRQGSYEDASRYYGQAEPLIFRAKEPENQGAISYLLSESLALAGQSHDSRAEGLRGLKRLSPYRSSNFLNNHLTTIAGFARTDGLTHASLALMDEVLSVAYALGKPDVIARAHRARARDLIALRRSDAARRDLDLASRWARRMGEGRGGDRVRADVELVRGQWLRATDPDSALHVLAGVAETFRTVAIGMNLPQALYEAGMAAEAAGQRRRARSFIHEAIDVLERQQAAFSSSEMRATFHETTENVFDAMIRHELLAGRPDSALAYLERARAPVQPGANQPLHTHVYSKTPPIAAIAETLPDDALFIDYALLNEQLSIWTFSRNGLRHHALPLRRDSIGALIARFTEDAREPDAGGSAARAQLFDLLLGPVREEMKGVHRLVIVPDRELYQVPFAALWDRRAGRYIVEDYELTTVPSVTFYTLARSRISRHSGARSALVIGNPALDTRSSSRLGDLPGALQEAEKVAALYAERRLLTGRDAGRETLLQLLPAHSVFHFAGHAVFNSDQPGSSYLAVAPDGAGADGTLTAREISGLRLSNVQVVVLSACSTLGPRPSRAGATAGLAYSFLHAGAPATVSTLWDVRDDATTPLLVEFHRRLRGGAPAAAALRLAQLQALRSEAHDARAPAGWAAFIYTGP
jgi:CHAT domain-containing protein